VVPTSLLLGGGGGGWGGVYFSSPRCDGEFPYCLLLGGMWDEKVPYLYSPRWDGEWGGVYVSSSRWDEEVPTCPLLGGMGWSLLVFS
jgi:hypothetical protein